MKYEDALNIANKYVEILKPYCDKIMIAGSIRRKKSFVDDIEICCIPKSKMVPVGLFEELQRDPGFVDLINSMLRAKGNGGGKYTRLILKEGISLDLFMTSQEQFGVIFMIRTGSAEYSKRMVTEIKPKFWVEGGYLWGYSGKIPCPEEEDFFRITGAEFIPPALRSF
jgi:DNA polymerase/3'-5' exonuclease PolX